MHRSFWNQLRVFKIQSMFNNLSAEIMQQLWPPQSRKDFWEILPGKNSPKSLFLKPNPLIGARIAQVSLIKHFFLEFLA
jgi:hypothetical protein